MSELPAGERPKGHRLVLVADDDPLQRRQIIDFLTRKGVAVIEANNGEVAIEQARHHRPAVVLLDAKMPGTDGLEAARVIKDFAWKPKVILMSGLQDYVVTANREVSGIFAVIEKPIPLRQLGRFVEEALLQVES